MGAKMIALMIAFASSLMWFSSLKKDPEPVTLRVTTYASLVTELRFAAPSPRLGSSAM
jgi:hypothetical protein